ncbi:MAG: HD domain-containing protein [Nanoarchaeota archaeon]|nr:HD domain-containing protein [Nanoarchaeota archaeon]
MDIIEKIRNFVESESKKPTSHYGYDPFKYHFTAVVKYAEELADKLGGDKEVIILAAWLHDVGSIMFGRKNHHITSAKIAEEKLKELNYPSEKIELIKKCILHHRGSVPCSRESIEEQIVTEADAMSAFTDITGVFQCALVYEKLERAEAKKSVIGKLERKWAQLHFKESKEIIKPLFEAAKLLLK